MSSGEYYTEIRNASTIKSDRYRDSVIYKDIETGELLLATREIKSIPERQNDIYHRVQSNEVSRLDILANKYYRNPLLWWVIAQANDIYDPFILLDPGTLLRIPAIESLYGNQGILL